MSDDIVISVENVSKAYRIWNDPGARLKSPLVDGLARLLPPGSPGRDRLQAKAAAYYRDFYALKDISFQVRKGEGVGIIGRNGSGKSTLLQIIAGTLQPSTGTVRVKGRVAALLELGSGFNPEFTGRENVYLNAAVLGFTRKQTDEKFDSIAAFADIGDFLDQPVKTYSSGMMMRLAFAVQTAVEPDILIVDEALSVGDAPFQARCFARVRSMQEAGCSTLFVSHDIGTVRAFCQQAVWLNSGQANAQGTSNQVCGAYQNSCLRAMGMDLIEGPASSPSASQTEMVDPTVSAVDASAEVDMRLLAEPREEFKKCMSFGQRQGNQHVQIRNFFLLDSAGKRSTTLHWDEEVTAVLVLGACAGYVGHFQVSVNVRTLQGVELLGCCDRTHIHELDIPSGTEVIMRLRTRFPLIAGKYIVFAGVFIFPDDGKFDIGTYDFTRGIAADLIGHAAHIEITPQFNLGIYGPVQQEAKLHLAPKSSPRAPTTGSSSNNIAENLP